MAVMPAARAARMPPGLSSITMQSAVVTGGEVPGGVKADGGHAGGTGGADAAGTVFDHDAIRGPHIQAFRSEKKDIGRGLAVGYQLGAVDMGAEIFGQVQRLQA